MVAGGHRSTRRPRPGHPLDAPAEPPLLPTPRPGAARPYVAHRVAPRSAVPAPDPWVDAVDGQCPHGYPVKARHRGRVYHLPGMAAYARTVPERCYCTAEDAESHGLRRAER